jgi:hypothetical protein
MAKIIKPLPRNQSQVTQAELPLPYLSQGRAISETSFSENRGTDYSLKDDTIKDISIGLQDIDNAVLFYFNNVIKPTVIQNEQRLAVPIIYGSQERWKYDSALVQMSLQRHRLGKSCHDEKQSRTPHKYLTDALHTEPLFFCGNGVASHSMGTVRTLIFFGDAV